MTKMFHRSPHAAAITRMKQHLDDSAGRGTVSIGKHDDSLDFDDSSGGLAGHLAPSAHNYSS